MLFKGRKPVSFEFEILLYGKALKMETFTKFLGIIIDKDLNWSMPIQYVKDKISKMCGILYDMRNCLTLVSRTLLYNALVYPYLNYGIVTWGNACDTHLNPLLIAQKRAIRIVGNVGYRDHTHDIFVNLNMLKLKEIHFIESVKLVYGQLQSERKVINFASVNQHHNFNLRNALELRPPRTHGSKHQSFVAYDGCIKWNSLLLNIRHSQTLQIFKRKVKSHLLQSYA